MTATIAAETDTPAEWADVARRKYEHYKALCDAYEAGGDNAPALVAIDVHQRHLAEIVPHLVGAIGQALEELKAVSDGLGQIFLDKPGPYSPRIPGSNDGDAVLYLQLTHQGVPVWGCPDCVRLTVAESQPTTCRNCGNEGGDIGAALHADVIEFDDSTDVDDEPA